MALFDIYTTVLAYEDSLASSQTNSPSQKFVDWTRKVQRATIFNPSSFQTRVDPQETVVLFDGNREIATDPDTIFELKSEGDCVYTLSHVSGPHPGFRTPRDISSVVGESLSVKVNKNRTITISCENEVFGNVVSGDTVFLSNAFGSNKGFWTAISVQPKIIHLNPSSSAFSPRQGTFAPEAGDFIAFSKTGVQPGDKLFLSGFPGIFEINTVTDSSLVFISSTPLPETEIQEIEIYEFCKRYIRLESDTEVEVLVNDSTPVRISPIEIQEFEKVGWLELSGPIHYLSVSNKENETSSVTLIAFE